jgi:lipopolysaccharide biosynthesis protein
MIKGVLFGGLPFFFNRLPQYHQWKESREFAGVLSMPWQRKFREKVFYNRDHVAFPDWTPSTASVGSENRLAVVIHAFYPDILLELLHRLEASRYPTVKLFITCPTDSRTIVEQMLQAFPVENTVLSVENRGRDILPFLKILPIVVEEKFSLVLKLHTKRSNYLNRKELWKDELFQKLLGVEQISNSISVLQAFPNIGILGPESHVVPMSVYYGANAAGVKRLSRQLGLKDEQLKQLNFVAGSMFYARTVALLPLLKLSLQEADFEEENGQFDGTLAHVVERTFSCSALAAGMLLADTSSTPSRPCCIVSMDHFFTR